MRAAVVACRQVGHDLLLLLSELLLLLTNKLAQAETAILNICIPTM